MLWSSGAVTLGEAAERMRSPGGALLSLGMMALAALSAFPAEAVALANGMVYGPLLGTAMTWSGAMLGACLAYGVARWMAPEPGPVLARIQAAADDPWALLTIRLIPLFPFFLVNYACGLAGVPRWRFVWTTAVGILPLSIVLSGVGEGLATQPLLVLPILGLAAIAGTITVLRRRR
ncbi:MAG: VTT domain-containing protein [Myxococcota bacterium]